MGNAVRVTRAGASSRDVSSSWRPDGPGRALSPHERSLAARVPGFDFGAIRIHHDATRPTRLGATAYALDDDIVTSRDPMSRDTLAHELVHIAQRQRHAVPSARPDGRYQAEANATRMAADVTAGRTPRDAITPPGAAIQLDRPSSLDEVAFEAQLRSLLARPIRTGDDAAALARVQELTSILSRLGPADAGLLHMRLSSPDDPLGQAFRHGLATATRERLLTQLETLAHGSPATPDATYFAGLQLDVPTRPVLVDPVHHPDQEVLIPLRAATPMPAGESFQADWTVERVAPGGAVSVVTSFHEFWMAGMTITTSYTVSASHVGDHYVTVRLRDASGAVVHIVRGTYVVTDAVPQSLSALIDHPQYVDSFRGVNYDPDFRPDRPGHLSYWVGLSSSDGWAYVDTRHVATTGTSATGFHWRDGRIFPAQMNPTSTPRLAQARRGVELWMDEYNTLFIIGSFVYGVWPILSMVPGQVGRMPAANARSRLPLPPRSVPPSRGTPPTTTTTGPAPVGRLPPPPTPNNMGLNPFGTRVMRWGTGNAAARARMSTLTRAELEAAGVTRPMAEQWRDFYRNEILRNPRNPSAAGRADLMQRAVELLR